MCRCRLFTALLLGLAAPLGAGETTGPDTERRFPPLQVPPGFRATLFACDPLVEYPSVIALGPRPGTLFVAHDYMTGLGVEIVRRDEIRLLADTDQDGYADQSTLYAGGFNSVQGLAYHRGQVFVMHAPRLTALRDTDGDGVADQRHDLLDGLGLPPEENSNRLHCANGVVAGHDGWLYLALGDRGCDVRRPEGDRLLFQEGGILRCRVDGGGLHVFATGLRNIYDVALDEQLNVFVRDNENDGGDYMIRVCHCFHGSDHGYPYHYYERPGEALPPLADLGRGSSAGGACYLETAFPVPYRRSLLFCEWGRAVMRYEKRRAGASFRQMQELDFAAGAESDPYGFKPTDLVVDHDGSLLISDWCDGQRPKRGRGRIYRVSAERSPPPEWASPRAGLGKAGLAELITQLNSASYHQRCAAQEAILARRRLSSVEPLLSAIEDQRLRPLGRMHAVWMVARSRGANAVDPLLRIAQSDPDWRVAAQALRAIGDVADPVLVGHRLQAGRGDQRLAARIADLASRRDDPRVMLEALTALGRLRWKSAPTWLRRQSGWADEALVDAATRLLVRCDNWPAVLELLDTQLADGRSGATAGRLRSMALRALADQADVVAVDGLLRRLESAADPQRRMEYADLLARVCRRPGPWTYWGFRPGPRPAKTKSWARTEAIQAALAARLGDADLSVRQFVLQRMRRENIAAPLEALAGWLRDDFDSARVQAVLKATEDFSAADARPVRLAAVEDSRHADSSRLLAWEQLAEDLPVDDAWLLSLAERLGDGAVLAAVLRELGSRGGREAERLLLAKLESREGMVRAAAMQALAARKSAAARTRVARLLHDPDARVRRRAAEAAGLLRAPVADRLLQLAGSDDVPLRRASLAALRRLGDRRAVAQATRALDTELLRLAALAYLREHGGPDQLDAVRRISSLDSRVRSAVLQTVSAWAAQAPAMPHRAALQRALAEIQGRYGTARRWQVRSFESADDVRRAAEHLASSSAAPLPPSFDMRLASGPDAVLRWADRGAPRQHVLAVTDVAVESEEEVEILASSDGALQVWLNGQPAYRREQGSSFRLDSDHFDGRLLPGASRLTLLAGPSSMTAASRLHLRFRRRSSQAEHERLTRLVLQGQGNAERGRRVLEMTEKSLCLKCHRVGSEGPRIGPDLAALGRRFSRIHILESILQPSRAVSPSYDAQMVALDSGTVVTGVTISEDQTTLTLGDTEGRTHKILKADIVRRRRQDRSIMPEGLEKRLSDRELMDLVAYLSSLR